MWGTIAALCFVLAMCVFCAWNIWLGFTRGYVWTNRGRALRANWPFTFWANLIICIVLLLLMAPILILGVWFSLTHPASS
jgi:hypothetical protein